MNAKKAASKEAFFFTIKPALLSEIKQIKCCRFIVALPFQSVVREKRYNKGHN
jgi:hypothetical protein